MCIYDITLWYLEQFNELFEKSSVLVANCSAFGMPKPRFESLDAVVDDFKSNVAGWDLLKGFYEELNAMLVQDWLAFSANVYALQGKNT